MTNLIDTSGAPLSTSEAANKNKKLDPLFFLSEDAKTWMRVYGRPVTNKQVEDSFNAWKNLSQATKNELNFLSLMMPR